MFFEFVDFDQLFVTEWWIELITDPITGTITKAKRSDYLELMELTIITEDNLDKNWYTKGERIKAMHPSIYYPKTQPLYLTINF